MMSNTKVAFKTASIDIEVEYITDMEKVLKPTDVEKLLHKLGF